jgi:CBS domain-containing protein
MYGFLEAKVKDYMTAAVVAVTPEASVGDLERQLAEFDFNGFPVVEDGQLLGMVTKFDLLRVFIFTPETVVPRYEELARLRARDIMTTEPIVFAPQTPLTRVLQKLVDTRVKSFPVVEAGRVVGIIAREDVVRALRDAQAG